MPTSSGGSYRYSSTVGKRSRPLPPGPGPLDPYGRRMADPLPMVSSSLKKTTTSSSYYPRDSSLSSPSYKSHNSTGTGMKQLSNSTYHHDTTSNFRKLDINDNPIPSYGKNSGYCTTTSSNYGSYLKGYNSSNYQSPSTTSKLSSSSRSSSVESTSQLAISSKSSQLSVGSLSKNGNYSTNGSVSDVGRDDDDDRTVIPVGLVNLGNTCFMNSVLQSLMNTRVLKDYVLSEKREQDINKTTSSMKGALMEAYGDLVQKVWRGNTRGTISPKELKAKVQRFAPRFNGYNQQDAQEFLRYLLQGLHEDVNRVKSKPKYIGCDEEAESRMSDEEKAREYWKRYLNFDNSAIVDIFVGQLKSVLKCQTCKYESVTFDPFWDLSLPIPKTYSQVDIIDCIESFMKEEILDGEERPTCEKCKTRRKCTKSFKIQRLPKVLVLHLKRFSGERFRQKLSTIVNFDIKGFSLRQFVVDDHQDATYNLYGICNHVGSVYSGHYTAYCKYHDQRKWYSFNDSHVDRVSEKRLVSDEAYVLFYELVR